MRAVIIDLHPITAICSICGKEELSRWGVPRHNGDLVSNDFRGEWGGSPACEQCHDRHATGLIETFDHLYEG